MRSGADPYYGKGTREVDFVLRSKDNTLTKIYVCYCDEIPDREYEGLKEFAGKFGEKVERLVILTKVDEANDGDIACIPLWKWLLDSGSR